MRDSFVLFTELKDVVDALSNDQSGMLFKAILAYESGQEPQIDDDVVKIAFIPIKRSLDKNNEKWEQTCEARRSAGSKGGKAKAKQSVAKKANAKFAKQSVANQADNEYEYDNENDNESVNDSKEKNIKKESEAKPHRVFVPPTIDEVKDYCWERNNKVDAQAFIDFYSSKGWMIGKNKMRDWKAAVRTWERNSRDNPKKQNSDVDEFFSDIWGG